MPGGVPSAGGSRGCLREPAHKKKRGRRPGQQEQRRVGRSRAPGGTKKKGCEQEQLSFLLLLGAYFLCASGSSYVTSSCSLLLRGEGGL